MVNLPLVSVVVPVYKTEKYIAETINSLINQTYKKLEIIVVDDGSPDDSYMIVESLKEKDERIKLVKQTNMGLSGARNTGIKISSGDYIIFVDSDDTLVPEAIHGMVDVALKTNSDMVIPDRYIKIFEGKDKQEMCFHFNESCKINSPIQFALNVIIGKGRAWRASALLYKSKTIKNGNVWFPIGYTSEDFVFNLLFLQNASQIDFYENVTLNYLKRQGSITTTFNANFFETILYLDKIVTNFLNKTLNNDLNGILKQKSLFCRNVVVYIISIFSTSNKMSLKEKNNMVDDILSHNRVQESFRGVIQLPYFKSKLIICYFSYMFFLLKHKFYKLAKISTSILSLFKSSI